jgi:hypothetical protein
MHHSIRALEQQNDLLQQGEQSQCYMKAAVGSSSSSSGDAAHAATL